MARELGAASRPTVQHNNCKGTKPSRNIFSLAHRSVPLASLFYRRQRRRQRGYRGIAILNIPGAAAQN
jgi:hypothetical protein